MNLSKLGTSELKSKIENGKIPADQLEQAKALLSKREAAAKSKGVKKETPAKKKSEKKKPEVKKKAVKKEEVKEKKERKARTLDDYSAEGVSGLVRKMLTPKKGSKVAGCTYSEANKAVQQQFKRKLHTSEFDRNFNVLKKLGVLDEKQPPRFKPASEKASEETAK